MKIKCTSLSDLHPLNPLPRSPENPKSNIFSGCI